MTSVKRVVAVGEFYLVRAGNTRKGTGTFYTRPQLAVPTVHRALGPLCYESREVANSRPPIRIPREPEAILGLKVCDPACGSASFLVAALHYLTDALYQSLCFHRHLDDPGQTKKLTLPFGRPRTDQGAEEQVPFPPDDPQRGHTFEDRVKALLRRHVVERCIYGVDVNPLAVELGPRLDVGRDARPRADVLVPRPQGQGRQLAGRLLAGPGSGLPAEGVGAGGRRRQGRPPHAADRGDPQGREGRQPPVGRRPRQAGDAAGHRDAVSGAGVAVRRGFDHPELGGEETSRPVRRTLLAPDLGPGRAGRELPRNL